MVTSEIWCKDETKKVVPNEVTGIAWHNDFVLAEQTKDNKLSYWIIDIKAQKVYGQLNEKEFQNEKKNLKISEKLKLKSPDEYKYLDKSNK